MRFGRGVQPAPRAQDANLLEEILRRLDAIEERLAG
jgi:hypothetical protein